MLKFVRNFIFFVLFFQTEIPEYMYSISEQLHPIRITLSLSPFTLVTTCLLSSLPPHLTCIYYHYYCITIISHITSFIVSHFISSVFKSVLFIHFIILAVDGCNTATASFQKNRLHDNRKVVCSLIHNTVDRENFSILLRDLNIMLRITQSTREGVSSSRLKQLRWT